MKKIIAAVTLLGALVSTSANANLITNGDFSTGDFSGWNLNLKKNDVPYVSVDNGAAKLGNYSFGSLSQTFATTIGQLYQISFDLGSPKGPGSSFTALFGGTTIFSEKNQAFNTTTFTFDTVATSSVSKLTFGFKDVPDYFKLDNVSVVPVPEPETYTMMLGGLLLLGIIGYKRRSEFGV
jgi:hypothetical protein